MFQILPEKIVQERPDDRNCTELPYLLPRRRHDAADDVGGKLELETKQEPHPVAAPDSLSLAMRNAGSCDNSCELSKRLDRTVRNDDDRRRFDQLFRGARDTEKDFLHVNASLLQVARRSGIQDGM